MCEMVSNICGSLSTGGLGNFASGGWGQLKTIGEIAKQALFLNRSGITENFSNLNLAGKVTAVVIGAVVASAIIRLMRTCAEQSSKVSGST